MPFTSASQVCGFIAIIRSTPPRRPSQLASETRTSYQVGRPWMLDGKMLRAPTGTPMRRMALANRPLALAEPEPFTLANLTTKSLVAVSGFDMGRWELHRRPQQLRRPARHGEVPHSGLQSVNEGRRRRNPPKRIQPDAA